MGALPASGLKFICAQVVLACCDAPPNDEVQHVEVPSNLLLCSYASLEVGVPIHNMGERIPISHPGTRTSCQPPDTYMNPYREILNFVVAHMA
jgi:hypothetical protein